MRAFVLGHRFARPNLRIIGGRLVGVFIQKADETTSTRYFHTDHLGSAPSRSSPRRTARSSSASPSTPGASAAIPTAAPTRRAPSPASRTAASLAHEQLNSVGLIHMNGRVEACPRVGEAEPGEPAARPLRHARPDDGEPVLDPGLEPLQLRRQPRPAPGQAPPSTSPTPPLLLHGLLLAARVPGVVG